MQYSNYYDQMNAQGAVFNGAVLLQASAEIGGQKHVYFNLKGAVKEAFRYPPIGGIIAIRSLDLLRFMQVISLSIASALQTTRVALLRF